MGRVGQGHVSPLARHAPRDEHDARMASQALGLWLTDSSQKLDELFAAHASVGGTAPGRRYATAQINASLVVQVAAHFQLFCRDLHSQAARALVSAAPPAYQSILRVALTNRRGLDRGNASPETIGGDFERFGFNIWTAASATSTLSSRRRMRLEQLNTWRNAIAHQDFLFTPLQQTLLYGTSVTLPWIRRWRSACTGLAQTLDEVVAGRVQAATGKRPW